MFFRWNGKWPLLPFSISSIALATAKYAELDLGDKFDTSNGVSTYQCLLDLAPSKTISDMKAYVPEIRYYDQREQVLSRKNNYPHQDIERRIISLRFQRTKTVEGFSFYEQMLNKREQETICNKDWYITVFTDGTVDSFISDTKDPRAKEEYQTHLAKVYQKK